MVSILISALVVFAILGIGLYFWQKPRRSDVEYPLPPPINPRGLFTEGKLEDEEGRVPALADFDVAKLIEQARNGELASLIEAYASGDRELFDRAVNELVRRDGSAANLLSLTSYMSRHSLPVNEVLARAILDSWKESPTRNTTSKALHIAALSDNPDLYRTAVETAINFWREGKLNNAAPAELAALFDGEFWVLSSRSRSSGAGFVLKQTLADARRELEAASIGSPRVSKGDSSNQALPGDHPMRDARAGTPGGRASDPN